MNFISAAYWVTAMTPFSDSFIQLRKIMEPIIANHEFFNFNPKIDYDWCSGMIVL